MVGALLYVGVLALVIGVGLSMQRWRLGPVVEAFRSMGAEPSRMGNAAMVSMRGVALTYELRPGSSRSWGRASQGRTVCSAVLPLAAPGLDMELRPQTETERWHVEAGRAVDVEVGDERFDASFVVEAAPAHMARAVLDAELRQALLGFFPCRVTYAGRELRFEKEGLVRRQADVRGLSELLLHMGARIGKIAEGAAYDGNSSPFRGVQEPRSMDAPWANAEVAALRAVREQRRAYGARGVISLVTFLVALGLAVFAARACAKSPQ